ncbi:MAG TPA: hypothetical protein PKN37_07155 [Mesotoga sp.]|nr:hypothetical protein [Mesotoga sp.]
MTVETWSSALDSIVIFTYWSNSTKRLSDQLAQQGVSGAGKKSLG